MQAAEAKMQMAFGGAKTASKDVSRLLREPLFLVLWLVPFGSFLLLTLLYSYGFLAVPSLCIVFSVIVGIASFFLVAFRATNPSFLPLAMLVGLAMIVGTVFGLYVYDSYAVFPMFYANSRIYSNVVPSQPSAAVSDAGRLVFSSESRVDVQHSVSYITESGYSYCVAPVRDASGTKRVEFWATGIGCCGDAGDFYCDDSADAAAHGGIVVFDNFGFFENARRDYYEKARRKAEASFALLSSDEPMYVRWVKEDNLWMLSADYRDKAIISIIVVSFVYLAGSFGISYLLYTPTKAVMRGLPSAFETHQSPP
mmetsp:Transcript_92413/g.188060  ORF Transcript_92413/g.188060 Transcript_92413/m.188060 type:complete len:311 (-) Transcript_92413:98-1030(-)